jgi:hypothetical protein
VADLDGGLGDRIGGLGSCAIVALMLMLLLGVAVVVA